MLTSSPITQKQSNFHEDLWISMAVGTQVNFLFRIQITGDELCTCISDRELLKHSGHFKWVVKHLNGPSQRVFSFVRIHTMEPYAEWQWGHFCKHKLCAKFILHMTLPEARQRNSGSQQYQGMSVKACKFHVVLYGEKCIHWSKGRKAFQSNGDGEGRWDWNLTILNHSNNKDPSTDPVEHHWSQTFSQKNAFLPLSFIPIFLSC